MKLFIVQQEGSADKAPGGAAAFKQYAQDANAHGRAVHVAHDAPTACVKEALPEHTGEVIEGGGGAAAFKQYAQDANAHGRAVHVAHDAPKEEVQKGSSKLHRAIHAMEAGLKTEREQLRQERERIAAANLGIAASQAALAELHELEQQLRGDEAQLAEFKQYANEEFIGSHAASEDGVVMCSHVQSCTVIGSHAASEEKVGEMVTPNGAPSALRADDSSSDGSEGTGASADLPEHRTEADSGGGAAAFKRYAQDANAHGRAVHVAHGAPTACVKGHVAPAHNCTEVASPTVWTTPQTKQGGGIQGIQGGGVRGRPVVG